jgi:anti-anti-sigma factor
MLRINIQSDKRAATLYCSGRIVFGMETETLRWVVMSRSERVLAIDLGRIETVDASGLGLLVELQDWAAKRGRAVRYTNASEFVGRLVVLTGLHCVLNMRLDADYGACTQAAAALTA